MEPRLTLVTLGVADLDRSVTFYRDVVGWAPSQVLDDVAFVDLHGVVLALWTHEQLAAELGQPAELGAYRAVALAHNVGTRDEVDAIFAALRAGGARITKEPAATDWGGYSGYFEDPDGHRWEVANNPYWPLDDEGRVRLPRG
jgi:catechol 2,3-dioxygenase-like lactoylglutathione lyase family enzyme